MLPTVLPSATRWLGHRGSARPDPVHERAARVGRRDVAGDLTDRGVADLGGGGERPLHDRVDGSDLRVRCDERRGGCRRALHELFGVGRDRSVDPSSVSVILPTFAPYDPVCTTGRVRSVPGMEADHAYSLCV
jgi:hypothetical protein